MKLVCRDSQLHRPKYHSWTHKSISTSNSAALPLPTLSHNLNQIRLAVSKCGDHPLVCRLLMAMATPISTINNTSCRPLSSSVPLLHIMVMGICHRCVCRALTLSPCTSATLHPP